MVGPYQRRTVRPAERWTWAALFGSAPWLSASVACALTPLPNLPPRTSTPGATLEFPAFSPEAHLIDDLQDGNLSDHPLLAACLIAAGLDGADFARYHAIWQHQREILIRQAQTPPELLEAMHRVLLREYVHDADSVQQLLDSGEYNCMSASFIFLTLCQEAGWEACAVTTRGHVRVHVHQFPDQDVETTCAQWRTALVPTGIAEIDLERGRSDAWRALSTAQFLAKIYFNRATRALQTGRWSDAIELASIACQLDPDDHSAAENRLAAYNEWALAAWQANQRELALSLIEQALRWAPDNATLLANRHYLQTAARRSTGAQGLAEQPTVEHQQAFPHRGEHRAHHGR